MRGWLFSVLLASVSICEPSVPGVACIEPGTYLPAGTYLGRVGNSGVTYEPHLHVAAYFWNTERQPARSWSVPIDFEALHVRRPPQTVATLRQWVVPATGDVVSNDAF